MVSSRLVNHDQDIGGRSTEHILLQQRFNYYPVHNISVFPKVQILSRLDHPNIISYYDNFEQEGVLMIEMEYADGG